MADSHKNFAYSTVLTAPSPTTTGTSLVVQSGEGAKFPTPPFNATVWPASTQPTSTNAEIVRVTAISTDTFTITRIQEGSSVRNILAGTSTTGDQIAATITTKTLIDAETPMTQYSPFLYSSSSATTYQTMATATGQSVSGSLLIFPVTVNQNIQFNQAIIPMSMSYTTSNAQGSNSYYSLYGLYTMNSSTALSLLSNSSFSIVESMNGVSRTWVYPTTTLTSGYGYGTLQMSTTAQIITYISGTRAIGLQFGGDVHLTRGIYYMGLMSIRSTANDSGAGINNLSTGGIIGQVIDGPHQVGSVSGHLPIVVAASDWGNAYAVSNSTRWWGRHMVGFINTSLNNFSGTTMPASIHVSALGSTQTALTVTVLPSVTFMSL